MRPYAHYYGDYSHTDSNRRRLDKFERAQFKEFFDRCLDPYILDFGSFLPMSSTKILLVDSTSPLKFRRLRLASDFRQYGNTLEEARELWSYDFEAGLKQLSQFSKKIGFEYTKPNSLQGMLRPSESRLFIRPIKKLDGRIRTGRISPFVRTSYPGAYLFTMYLGTYTIHIRTMEQAEKTMALVQHFYNLYELESESPQPA